MKTFEEVKQEILASAKRAGACVDGYTAGLGATSNPELLKVITDNWRWAYRYMDILNAKYFEDNFTEEELEEAGIYTRGTHESWTASFACGSATVEAHGTAKVRVYDTAKVKAYDKATVEAYDNTTVRACGNATVVASGNATVEVSGNATVVACGNAIVKASGNSTVKALGKAIVKAYDNATVKALDKATVKALGKSTVEDYTGNVRPQSNYAIVKDYRSNKIYVKKGRFKIIEVD